MTLPRGEAAECARLRQTMAALLRDLRAARSPGESELGEGGVYLAVVSLIGERDELRRQLDVTEYVRRTGEFMARAHAAEAERDELLAAATAVRRACFIRPNVLSPGDVTVPADAMANLDAAIARIRAKEDQP